MSASKRKPGNVPADVSREQRGNAPVTVSHGDIAHRAFEIYCERGCQHGHDMDDWLQAERELRSAEHLRLT